MAKDLNKVMIIGRLGADPEMRFTPQGTAVTTFRVASSRQWRDDSGELREETEWFRVVAWDKLAEICNEHLSKGRRVYVEGRLQTRSWEDSNTGEKRYMNEVVAQEIIFLDSSRGGASAENEPPVEVAAAAAPQPRRNVPVPVEDEDLPF